MIGLNYFHPHRFRSRAVVSYGAPISIEPELVENYIKGGQAKREAISSLLNSGYEALKSVTVNAPNYDTLMVSCFLFEQILVINEILDHCNRSSFI